MQRASVEKPGTRNQANFAPPACRREALLAEPLGFLPDCLRGRGQDFVVRRKRRFIDSRAFHLQKRKWDPARLEESISDFSLLKGHPSPFRSSDSIETTGLLPSHVRSAAYFVKCYDRAVVQRR